MGRRKASPLDMRSSWELEYSKEISYVSDHFPMVLLSTISELHVSIFCSLSTELKWNALIDGNRGAAQQQVLPIITMERAKAGTSAAHSLSVLSLILAVPYST